VSGSALVLQLSATGKIAQSVELKIVRPIERTQHGGARRLLIDRPQIPDDEESRIRSALILLSAIACISVALVLVSAIFLFAERLEARKRVYALGQVGICATPISRKQRF